MDNDIDTIYTNITNAINFQTKNSPAFDQLIKFQLSILNDLILPSPYESSTPDFIDKFSVKVIRNILNTAVSDSSIIKTFSTILENYARIMIFIFDQPNLSFLESASHITNPSNIFYTALSSRNPPKIYTQIINLFRTKHFYEQITNFFEKNDSLPLKHVSILINLLISTKEKTEIYINTINFIFQKSISIFRTYNYDDLREIDDKLLNSTLDSIYLMEQNYLSTSFSLEFQLEKNILFSKSDILEKRFNGINKIATIISKESSKEQTKILTIVNDNKILDSILNDFHHQLVNPFVSILKQFIQNKIDIQTYLVAFWKVSVNQNSSLAPEFSSGWNNLISDKKIKKLLFNQYSNALFDEISIASSFPESFFSFLDEIASFANEAQKEQVFTSLLIFASNQSSEISPGLTSTVLNYMPKNDERIIKESLEMIKNDFHIKFAISLISNLKLNSDYLCSLINALNSNNAMEIIDLLWKMLDRFGSLLNEDQFLKITEIYLQFLKSDPEKVVEFFVNTTSKSIFSCEMKKELFKRICELELEFSESFISLILHLFKSINSENKVKDDGIELLWEIAYKTKNKNLIIFLNSHIGTLNYVETCMKNIRIPGSLECLNIIIKTVENNMNNHVRSFLNLPLINQYIDDDFLINVKIVGYIEATLMLTKNTTYSTLRFYLSLLTKVNINNLILSSNGSVITNFDGQINTQTTIDVKVQSSNGLSFKFDIESEIPSLILFSNATYTLNLMSLIEDEQFGVNSLKILNEMPIIHNFSISFNSDENDQTDKSNEFRNCNGDWNKFLSFDNPNHLIYHLNSIGNYIDGNDKEWIGSFFKTGGALRLIDLLLKTENNLSYNSDLKNEFLLLLLLLIKKLFSLEFNDEMSQIIQKVDNKEFVNFLNYTCKLFSNDDISYYLLYVIEKMTIIRGIPQENVDCYVELFSLSCFQSNEKIVKIATEFLHKKEIESMTIMIKLLPKAVNTNNCDFVNSIVSLVSSQSDDKELIWNALLDSTFEYFSPLKNKDVVGIWKNLNKSYPEENFMQTLLSAFMHMIGLFKCIENDENYLEIPRIEDFYFFLFDEILYNEIVYFQISPKLINLLNQIITIKPSLIQETIPRIEKIQQEMKSLENNTKTSLQNNTNKGPESHIKGLRNLGATCYMASILQQLYSIPVLRSSLLNLDCEINDKNKWLHELQYLFLKMLIYPTSSSFIDPSNFVKEWRGADENLVSPHQQQDAEEHLSLILSRLEPNLPTIDSLFKGEIKNHVQGEGENKQYERDFIESFFDISLEVKGYKNISSSFDAFKSPDKFEGKNQFVSDELGPIDAIQTHLVLKASPILIFTLKRIQFSMTSFMKEKINSRYEFPLTLDISPILADNKSSLYELYGVIIHKGTADAGHYISHIRDKMNNWRVYNDSNVHVETINDMIKSSYGGNDSAVKFGSGSAYILFYRKIGFDFECESGFDKVNLPVSSSLIERIACDIKKEILTEISLSKEYFMFIASIIQDVKILISLLSQNSGISKECKEVIMNICVEKCKSKDFADSILSFYTNEAFDYIKNEENSHDLITNESLITLVKKSLVESSSSSNDFINKLIQKIKEIDQISDEKLDVYGKNINIFYQLIGDKIDASESVNILIDYVSKNQNRNIGSIISLLIKMDKNNKGISNLSNFFTDEILLNYLINNDSKEFLDLFIRRIKKEPSKIDIIFGLDPKEIKNLSVYGKIFICILASKSIKSEDDSLFKNSTNYMDFFFSNYLRSQNKDQITAIFEYINSIISDFIDDTINNFIYYSDIFIDKLLLSYSYEVRRVSCSLFLKFIFSKSSDQNSFTRSLFTIYTLLIKRMDYIQQCCTSKMNEKGMNYEKLKETLQVEEYFYLLTNIVEVGHFNNNVLNLSEKLANFLNATATPFIKYKGPCFIRKHVVDFITSTITKENSTKFFGNQGETLKIFLKGIPIFSQPHSYGKQEKDELETYSDSYIKFILLIPVHLFHHIANTYFLSEILKSTKYMQNQLSYELYKLICNYLDIQNNYVVSNFANIFFFYCLNCHLEAGRKIPIKIGIHLFKKNPELTEIFYNNSFYQNVWSLIYEKISEYTVQKTKNRIPVDSSVFPLMNLLGVFISQFTSIPENKIESHWSRSKYYYLSSYFKKYSINPSIILQFSLYENEVTNLNDIFDSKGSFVFLQSLFTLDVFSECEEIYISTLAFVQTNKGFISKVPKKSKLAATKFLLTVLHWAKKTVSTLSNGPYAAIIINELSRYINSIYKRDTSEKFNRIDRKSDFEILNLFSKEVSMYYFYADDQSIQGILASFKKLMSYPDGVLYFNSKELTEVCLNVMKKNNVQPINWIINIQKFILNLINNTEYSEESVEIFVKAGKIIDDLMILFEIKEIPKIQLDEQSRSNQEKWAQMAQIGKGEKDEFVLLHLFTILVADQQS